MRVAWAVVAVLPAGPIVAADAAPREEERTYAVVDDGPARFQTVPGAGMIGVNGVMFAPLDHEKIVTVVVRDAAGPHVPLGICHEWTFDDGSHPVRTCWPRACGPEQTVTLTPRPSGATYQRVVVFLFDEPWGCASRATAGTVAAAFT